MIKPEVVWNSVEKINKIKSNLKTNVHSEEQGWVKRLALACQVSQRESSDMFYLSIDNFRLSEMKAMISYILV